MPCHSRYKHPNVEGHNSQHDQISQPCPESIDEGLNGGAGNRALGKLGWLRVAQELDGEGQQEDEEEGQYVHANTLFRPP